MAMKHIERIVQELQNAGRPTNEPMAFVCNASMPNQTDLETTLGTCLEDVKKSNIKPPSVVVVGEVVNLRQGLDWLGAENGKLLINNIHPQIVEKQTG
jgi:uroporphyrin-III C-methyltransferase